LLITGPVLLAALVVYFLANRPPEPATTGAPLVAVIVPDLSLSEQAGEAAFNSRCASCHGINAAGQDGVAPPLVHRIYEPGHHGDQAFLVAAQLGVRAHHWRFGDMPPVERITTEEVALIVTYVRALQRANGIE
jgi:mono/diheme cytochrome c family protein